MIHNPELEILYDPYMSISASSEPIKKPYDIIGYEFE